MATYVNVWDRKALPHWLPGLSSPSFNAGVLVLNLRRWRERGTSHDFERIFGTYAGRAELQKSAAPTRPWRHGSQPPLLLRFLREGLFPRSTDVFLLPPEWNVDGLGHGCQSSLFDRGSCEARLEERLKRAKILHYTGPHKPWFEAEGLPAEKRERFLRNKELWRAHAGQPVNCVETEGRGGGGDR